MQSSSLAAPAAGQAQEMWDASAARLGREIDLNFTPLGVFFFGFVSLDSVLRLC